MDRFTYKKQTMKTITKENAKTKAEFAALIFAHKNDDFNSFMSLAEDMLDQYAAEESREKENSAWLRGFNEGRLAHPRKEQEGERCTCGGFPDCICKEQEEQC